MIVIMIMFLMLMLLLMLLVIVGVFLLKYVCLFLIQKIDELIDIDKVFL